MDDTDKQANQNLYSLIKGEKVTLSSLNIIGDLSINGQIISNTIQNGKLVFDNKIQFPKAEY